MDYSFEGQEAQNPNCIDPVIEWCIKHVDHDDIFVDAGAHIGRSCIPVMKEKKPIHSILIEAVPPSVARLRKNVEEFVGGKAYEIIAKVLWDSEGEIDFTYNPESPIQSSVFDRFTANKESVIHTMLPSTTLDSLLEKHTGIKDNKIVIKMDIELSEWWAWQGMKKNLHRVKAVCMEFMPSILIDAKIRAKDFIQEIQNDGFEVLKLDGTYPSEQELYSPEGSKIDIYLRNVKVVN